jgi:hypothetical protein
MAAVVIALFMLNPTTHALGLMGSNASATFKPTGTLEADYQSMVNGTLTASSQVVENETEGDNVNLVELDQNEQAQILAAETNGTIAGEVEVNDTGVFPSVVDSRFHLIPVEGANGRLDIQVSGENVTGPRSFLVFLSKAMDPTTHTLVITLDGQRVTQASSLGQVLSPSSGASSYIAMKSPSGYQLLVSIPHFSTHLLSILPLIFGPAQGFFAISGVSLSVALVAITAIFAVAFISRKRISGSLAV